MQLRETINYQGPAARVSDDARVEIGGRFVVVELGEDADATVVLEDERVGALIDRELAALHRYRARRGDVDAYLQQPEQPS